MVARARPDGYLLTQLTALEHLCLLDTALTPRTRADAAAGDPCYLSSLQQLTSLELGGVKDGQLLHGFAGCTGLQDLRLNGMLPY